MVNLEWYRTFQAIYTSGTLTGAAGALFMSQPGVSLHLNSLESYVGYKLFDRSSRKMAPTERGKILYNALAAPLQQLVEIEKKFHKTNSINTPTISVGMCFETFQTTLEQFVSSLPFNLIISFGAYPEMLDQLEKGILDLIVTPQKSKSTLIEHEAFTTEQLILVAGKTVDRSSFQKVLRTKDKSLVESWLKNEKWYGTTGDMEQLFQFWTLNFGHKPDFRPNYIVPNLSSIVRCLGSGTGLAVIPDFLCQTELENGQLQLLWEGDNKLKNNLYFANRKLPNHPKELNHIKGLFRKIMRKK